MGDQLFGDKEFQTAPDLAANEKVPFPVAVVNVKTQWIQVRSEAYLVREGDPESDPFGNEKGKDGPKAFKCGQTFRTVR